MWKCIEGRVYSQKQYIIIVSSCTGNEGEAPRDPIEDPRAP